jgi:hypothetical protein
MLEGGAPSPQGTKIGDGSPGGFKRGAITGEFNTNPNLLRRRITALQLYFCVCLCFTVHPISLSSGFVIDTG